MFDICKFSGEVISLWTGYVTICGQEHCILQDLRYAFCFIQAMMELGNISFLILSYIFHPRWQQVVLSGLLINITNLADMHIKKILMVLCSNILKSSKEFPSPLNLEEEA